jgi:hypothetical protein
MPAIEVCHIVNVLSVCTGVDNLGICSLTPGDTTRLQFELNAILNSAFLHRRLSILTFSYPVLNSHCSTFQNLTQLDVIHNIWIEWSLDVFDSLPISPVLFVGVAKVTHCCIASTEGCLGALFKECPVFIWIRKPITLIKIVDAFRRESLRCASWVMEEVVLKKDRR